ncbi:MAG: hypothetical protein IJ805_00570 [Lachnospiraceae bacterium]|nr:hypothetical protein [Lachnospiraceae bacterium]
MSLYPEEEMYQEMSFIAYYFHWSEEDVLKLEHTTRRRWCSEISKINQKLNPSKKEKKEKSILEMSPGRKG